MAIAIRLSSSIYRKHVCLGVTKHTTRSIMTSRLKFEKALEDLKRNPYFDKYAQKIAKLQETSPEEFLERVENQEKKLQAKQVHLTRPNHTQSLWGIPFSRTKVQPLWAHVRKNNFSNQEGQNTYITTPIFYVNAGPHIGHLYTAVLADTWARYNSMLGHSVFLCTGTDEHGTKVEKAANIRTLSPSEYSNLISKEFRNMCDTFNVEYSRFMRTTEEQHKIAVHHFWDRLEKGGHIHLGRYCGWYSMSDEAFVSESELTEVKDDTGCSIKVCIESGNPVEWTEEDTYKFRLTLFEDDVKHWLKDENTVQPAMYRKSLLSWIEKGLQDLSISRPISRVPWAIPTPSDKSHTVYVWLDALVNYLTAVGYPDSSFRQFWPPTIQIIGKDILKFHGIFWPAFLIAAGLEPPKQLLCHGHWTVDDIKMSKSKANVISPFDAMANFTADGLRYFLLRQAVLDSDANYNVGKIQRILNDELANTFGNIFSRCMGHTINPNMIIPDPIEYISTLKSDVALENIKVLEALSEEVKTLYDRYHLNQATTAVMDMLRITNRVIEHHRPWALCKSKDLDKIRESEAVISLALESLRVAALLLYPIVPRLTSTLLDLLQVPKENRTWKDAGPLHVTKSMIGDRSVSQKQTLFQKIN